MHTSCFQSLLHRLSQRLRVPIARDHHLHCPRPRPRPTKVQHQPLSLLEDQTSRTSSGAMAAAQLCVAAKLQREEVPVQPQSAATYPFTVLTFNVLADGLAQDGDFVHAPAEVLQWQYRLPLVLQELQQADADIICIQELNHYDDVAAVLQPQGYTGYFYPKPVSPCLRLGAPADGTAIFYRSDRFAALHAPQGHPYREPDGSHSNQGYVVALLEDRQAGRLLVLAATHLKAKSGEENEQQRLRQAQELLQHVQQIAAAAADGGPGGLSGGAAAVICGDFNTEPSSSTCQALRQSHALPLRCLWDSPAACSNGNGSSISSSSRSSKEEWTTWKVRSNGEVRRIIDYVWYCPQQLVQLSRSAPLEPEAVGCAALPCAGYPSDHLAVWCRLGWAERSTGGSSCSGGNGSSRQAPS